jgi:hypothetical protein
MKKPGKNETMPKRIRQRAMNMAMADRSGASMPPAMSSAPMAPPPGMAPPSGMAPPAMKKGGVVKEKASGERYASKGAMAKHEAKESKSMERKEVKMSGGGIAVKGKGVALKKGGLPNIGRVKGVTPNKPKLMVVIAVGKGKKK